MYNPTTKEEWKPVINYENLYEVSNLGAVKSLDHITIGRSGRKHRFNGRLLKPCLVKGGYHRIVLCKNGKTKKKMIHVLVMESFIGPKPKGTDVIHLEHVKVNSNNSLENLRYATKSCNMAFKYDDGTIPNQKGENGARSKLKEKDVIKIKKLLKETNILQKEIAEIFNVARPTISLLATGKNWSYLND